MAESTNQPAKRKRDTLIDARDTAYERARETFQGLESNPIGVLVGGLAFGLIAGAFVPRSAQEKKMLKPVGKRLADGAVAAVTAAKATGKEQLSGTMLSKDAAKEGARKVIDSALAAAKSTDRADMPKRDTAAKAGTAA